MNKRVSSTVTKPTRRKANPRPRKYASASERQAAYRARAPEVCFRAEQKTVETLDRIAETLDQSRADVLLSMTKFALANHDWARFGLTHKPLPFEYGVNPIMATKKRKPTPAQLAARERFAEMARSGAFAKGRKRNPADAAPFTVTWKSTASGRMQSSNYRTKAEAVRDAQSLAAEGAKNVEVSKYSPATGAVVVEWRKTNPARKAAGVRRNPIVKDAVSKLPSNFKYGVQTKVTENWSLQAAFKTKVEAMDYAQAIAKNYPRLPIRVVTYTGGPIPA